VNILQDSSWRNDENQIPPTHFLQNTIHLALDFMTFIEYGEVLPADSFYYTDLFTSIKESLT